MPFRNIPGVTRRLRFPTALYSLFLPTIALPRQAVGQVAVSEGVAVPGEGYEAGRVHLVAAPILEAAGVLHAAPGLRLMPDGPVLEEYRDEFAGVLGLIEERPDENDSDTAQSPLATTALPMMVLALVRVGGVYVVLGTLFAVPFLSRGVGCIDDAASGSPPGFRALIAPGAILLWPVLAKRWLAGSDDIVNASHRRVHRRAWTLACVLLPGLWAAGVGIRGLRTLPDPLPPGLTEGLPGRKGGPAFEVVTIDGSRFLRVEGRRLSAGNPLLYVAAGAPEGRAWSPSEATLLGRIPVFSAALFPLDEFWGDVLVGYDLATRSVLFSEELPR